MQQAVAHGCLSQYVLFAAMQEVEAVPRDSFV